MLSIQPLSLPLLRNYLQRLTEIRECAAMGEDKGCLRFQSLVNYVDESDTAKLNCKLPYVHF